MRNVVSHSIHCVRRSGDRIGVEGRHHRPQQLGAEIVRLARLATSIHMIEKARLMTEHEPAGHAPIRASAMREPQQ